MRTVNYKEKDYDQIFLEMMQDAYRYKLVSTDERFLNYIQNREDIENNYCLFLSVYAFENDKIYEDMTRLYNSNDLEKATGKDLDILGNKFGIPRPQARRSSVKLVFTRTNNSYDNDLRIPQGTIVSTNNGSNYYTVETATIIKGRTSVEVTAYSSYSGYNSRVDRNTLINTSLNDVTVTNPKGSSGGRGAYSDDEYRRLIRNWTYSHIKGTREAYELFFAYYDGVDDYRLVPLWDGAGTLKIIVDPDDDWILEDIGNKIDVNVKLLDDDVLVIGALHRRIDINCTVNVDIDNVGLYSYQDKDIIKERVANALALYIDGGYRRNGQYYPGLKIGEDFVPFQAGLFVAQEVPEVKSIDFRDTIKNIDNILLAGEFSNIDTTEDENCYDKSTGILYGNNKTHFTSPLLYITNSKRLVSDNDGFLITFWKDGKQIYPDPDDSKMSRGISASVFDIDGLDLYGATMHLVGRTDKNASISKIIIYGTDKNDSTNSYNSHIRITDDEIGVSGEIVVNMQDDYVNDDYSDCY